MRWRPRSIAARDAELDEEIRAHFRMAVEERMARGETRTEAERAVRREFGDVLKVKEATRAAWGGLWLERASQDVRYSLRALRRAPAFTAAAVLTLALGIGATSTVFAVINGILLRPLPFPDPDRLVLVSYAPPASVFLPRPGLSDRHYLALRDHPSALASLATFANTPVTLTGAGEPVLLNAATVTSDFFRTLGVSAALGRGFREGDGDSGAEPVAVLGDALWRSRFGGNPRVVGSTIRLDGAAVRVVGVMPAGFDFPDGADLWTPLSVRADPNLTLMRPVVGRLRDGVALRAAREEFGAFTRGLEVDDRTAYTARLDPLKDYLVGRIRGSLRVFAAAVGFVLLIACGNVANLLLMRATGRTAEITIRAALGASRARLVRQLATESVVLSLLGGVAGIAVSAISVKALLALAPSGRIPRAEGVHVDATVLAFTLLLAALVGLGFGLLPALRATRLDRRGATPGIGSRRPMPGHARLRGSLVVCEIALALLLLTGAGLMLRSFQKMRSVELGFLPRHVATLTLDLPVVDYPEVWQMKALQSRILEGLSGRPGVESSATVNWRPFGGMTISGDFHPDAGGGAAGEMATKLAVSPGYFRTMGIRLLRGRDFDAADGPDAPPVVIVSRSIAERVWPGQDPLGHRLSMRDDPGPGDWLTVVGVVEDVLQSEITMTRDAAIYQPVPQVDNAFFLRHLNVVVRSSADPAATAAAVREAVHAADPNLPVGTISMMSDVVTGMTAEPLFHARLISAFSALGLVLAAIGVYGLLAFEVAQRRLEIGIRMALGAQQGSVVAGVLRRTLILSAAGVAVGAAGALSLTHLIRGFLFGVTATDPLTFAVVATLLTVTGLLAGWIPARRAARVEPASVLRLE